MRPAGAPEHDGSAWASGLTDTSSGQPVTTNQEAVRLLSVPRQPAIANRPSRSWLRGDHKERVDGQRPADTCQQAGPSLPVGLDTG
jgi:hypothetical protein